MSTVRRKLWAWPTGGAGRLRSGGRKDGYATALSTLRGWDSDGAFNRDVVPYLLVEKTDSAYVFSEHLHTDPGVCSLSSSAARFCISTPVNNYPLNSRVDDLYRAPLGASRNTLGVLPKLLAANIAAERLSRQVFDEHDGAHLIQAESHGIAYSAGEARFCVVSSLVYNYPAGTHTDDIFRAPLGAGHGGALRTGLLPALLSSGIATDRIAQALFDYTPAAQHLTIPATAATFVITAASPGVIASRQLLTSPGEFAVSGSAGGVQGAHTLAGSSVAFDLAVFGAGLSIGRLPNVMQATVAVFIISISPAGLYASRRAVGGSASYEAQDTPAILTYAQNKILVAAAACFGAEASPCSLVLQSYSTGSLASTLYRAPLGTGHGGSSQVALLPALLSFGIASRRLAWEFFDVPNGQLLIQAESSRVAYELSPARFCVAAPVENQPLGGWTDDIYRSPLGASRNADGLLPKLLSNTVAATRLSSQVFDKSSGNSLAQVESQSITYSPGEARFCVSSVVHNYPLGSRLNDLYRAPLGAGHGGSSQAALLPVLLSFGIARNRLSLELFGIPTIPGNTSHIAITTGEVILQVNRAPLGIATQTWLISSGTATLSLGIPVAANHFDLETHSCGLVVSRELLTTALSITCEALVTPVRRDFLLPIETVVFLQQTTTALLIKANALATPTIEFSVASGSIGLRATRKLVAELSTGTLTLNDCGVKMVNSRMTVDQGLFSVQGVAALWVSRRVYPEQSTFTETAQLANLQVARRVAPVTQAFATVGNDIDNRRPNRVISVTRAIITVTASDGRVAKFYNLITVGDTFATTVIPAGLRVERKLGAGVGIFYTGWQIVTAAVRFPATSASVACNGAAATLRFGHKLHPPVDSFALSVFDSSIRRTHTVVPTTSGTVDLAGSTCGFRATWVFHVQMAVFLSPEQTAVVAAHWRRNAEATGFGITATAATFPVTRKLLPASALFQALEATAGLRAQRKLVVETGVFSETTVDDSMLADRAVLCSVREHAVTAKPAGLTVSRRIPAELAGFEVTLTQGVIWYGWLFPVTSATFTIPTVPVVLRKGWKHPAEVTTFVTLPQDAVLRRGSVLKTEGINLGTGTLPANFSVTRRIFVARGAFTRYALGVTKLQAGRKVPCTSGSFTVQTTEILTSRIHRLNALTAAVELQGGTIGILGNFIVHDYDFPVTVAVYDITGQAVLRAAHRLLTDSAQFSVQTKTAVQAVTLLTISGVFTAVAKTAVLTVTRAQQQTTTHYSVGATPAALIVHRTLLPVAATFLLGPFPAPQIFAHRITAETGVFGTAPVEILYSSTYALAAMPGLFDLDGIEVPIYRTHALILSERFEFLLYPEERFEFNCGQQSRFTLEYSQPQFVFYRDERFIFYIGNDTRLSLE